MKKTTIAALTAAAATGVTLAQSGPLDAITTSVDAAAGVQNLETLTVTRGGFTETFTLADLLSIEVRDVATAVPPQGGPALLITGNPADADAVAPAPGSRAGAVLGDAALNTTINNPGNFAGITFGFEGGAGLFNGVGADLVLFEVGPAPGVPPIGAQNASFAVPGDPFNLAGTGGLIGNIAGFGPEFYGQFGSIEVESQVFVADLPDDGLGNVTSIDEFESVDLGLGPVVAAGFFTIYGVAIDLSDLGFEEGVFVDELELFSNPLLPVADSGAFTGPFGVDPSFIAGLPPVVPAHGAVALAGVLGLAAGVRRRR